ncbi:MAG: helix-turn-helix domain-containing protein [Bacteroidales bacterium]
MIPKLHYKNEHVGCSKYKSKEDAAFFFESTSDAACIYKENACKNNLLMFVVEGSIRIKSHYFRNRKIGKDEMFAIPKDFSYQITTSGKTRLLFFYFDSPASSCSKQVLNSYRKLVLESEYKGTALMIKTPVQEFIQLLDIYLTAGASCAHLHDLKKEEVFLNLRWFYSKEDLAHLFFPILKHTCSFRRFVLDNCEKVNNVTEMIEYSNLSKSVFYEKFKKEFGVSAKQWMVNRLKNKMLFRVSEPDITAKDLMSEFNFSSPEHLNSFCKKQFGMTPTDLIRTHQNAS